MNEITISYRITKERPWITPYGTVLVKDYIASCTVDGIEYDHGIRLSEDTPDLPMCQKASIRVIKNTMLKKETPLSPNTVFHFKQI